MHLTDLQRAHLSTVSKLAKICAAFQIDATLPDTPEKPFFTRAIDERLNREAMLREENRRLARDLKHALAR